MWGVGHRAHLKGFLTRERDYLGLNNVKLIWFNIDIKFNKHSSICIQVISFKLKLISFNYYNEIITHSAGYLPIHYINQA